MELVEMEKRAFDFAHQAHGLQKRKYTEEPYINHLERVANLVKSVPHTPTMVCAAYLHDVLKHTTVSPKTIRRNFGKEVALLVDELTDEFTKEAYPHLNRRWRKKKEAERMSKINWGTQTIKLADILDNLPGIVEHDLKFAKTYVREVEVLLENLQDGDASLRQRVTEEIQAAKNKIEELAQ
nr:HD domain protein [uncultured bacterium]